jgi:hypothetical protein
MRVYPAQIWTEALRSGAYRQGTESLTTIQPDGTQRDCCLGVQCKLYGKVHPTFTVEQDSPDEVDEIVVYYGRGYDNEVLPETVQAWSGMKTQNGQINHPFMLAEGDMEIAVATRLCPSDDWDANQRYLDETSVYTVSSERFPLSLAMLNDAGFTFEQIADVIDFFRENL